MGRKTKTKKYIGFPNSHTLGLLVPTATTTKSLILVRATLISRSSLALSSKNPRFIELGAKKLMSDSEGSSGFSSARGTIEEHVWALSQKQLLAENTSMCWTFY
jgi:hypothetical protein